MKCVGALIVTMKVFLAFLIVTGGAWCAHGATVNCTSAGRYANPADTTCKNYTLCVYDSSTATYLGYDYTCPTTSVFNPTTSQCTASGNYVCNVTNSTSSVCTEDGYISNPNSTDCTEYIECVEINGTFTETGYACPNGTYFDPNTTFCEFDYNCTSTDDFTCTAAGRFPDDSIPNCKGYYFCVEQSDGTFTQYQYNCTSTAMFNPNTSLCTASYTCTT